MKKIFLLSIICIGFFVAWHAFAAEIFFGVKSNQFGLGSKFELGVFVNAQGQPINAVGGHVIFPADAFDFQGFYTGNSALAFWVTQPALISPGVVSFSGIVPGGFTGDKEYLFSLILKPKQKGAFTITTSDEKILLNDGSGSEAQIAQAPLSLKVVQTTSQSFEPPADTTAPELFVPSIGQDPNTFNGKYFLAFAAQDKSSGIDHYEVMESPQLGSFKSVLGKSSWVAAASPYLLQDQSLQSDIYVKAVDKAGNAVTVKVHAKHFTAWYENYFVWGIILLIGIIFIGYYAWKKRRF